MIIKDSSNSAPTPEQPRVQAAHDASLRSAAGKSVELNSVQLFGNATSLIIHHAGERYTLRRTSKGKLILTK